MWLMHYHVLIYDSGRVDRNTDTASRMNPFENSQFALPLLCAHCNGSLFTLFPFPASMCCCVLGVCFFLCVCACLSFGVTAHTVLLGDHYLLGVGVFQCNIPLSLETRRLASQTTR